MAVPCFWSAAAAEKEAARKRYASTASICTYGAAHWHTITDAKLCTSIRKVPAKPNASGNESRPVLKTQSKAAKETTARARPNTIGVAVTDARKSS
jgi:hypothetical protein